MCYVKDGRHVILQDEEKVTAEQQQLLKTQDLKYVEMKHRIEAKVVVD